jgi:RNA polymerase sigma-70 factor (ECF subfamily)
VSGAGPSADADLELVQLARAGHPAAFGELFDRHHRAVFRTALAALGSHAEADDVTQEAFVTAYRKLDTFRGDASFKTWLLTIAWRKALDRRASLTRWVKARVSGAGFAEDTADPIDAVQATDSSAEDRLAGEELRRHVRGLIGRLPRKLRDALLLAGSGEHTYEQIAHMLRVPVGTAKWRVSEARRVLRQKLGAMGYQYD